MPSDLNVFSYISKAFLFFVCHIRVFTQMFADGPLILLALTVERCYLIFFAVYLFSKRSFLNYFGMLRLWLYNLIRVVTPRLID